MHINCFSYGLNAVLPATLHCEWGTEGVRRGQVSMLSRLTASQAVRQVCRQHPKEEVRVAAEGQRERGMDPRGFHSDLLERGKVSQKRWHLRVS